MLSMYFCYLATSIYLPLEKDVALDLKKCKSLSLPLLSEINWPSGSEEEHNNLKS